MDSRRHGGYRGAAPAGGGLLVVSESHDDAWRATASGAPLERVPFPPFNAFRLSPGQGEVDVYPASGAHRIILFGQAVLALGVISLALRPPGFTQRKAERAAVRSLPAELADPSPEGIAR